MKKKVLWIGDAGNSSGFARVTHAVLDRLAPEYDFTSLAIGLKKDDLDSKAYPMLAATKGEGYDPLGIRRLNEMLRKEGAAYDAVMVFQDIWNLPFYVAAGLDGVPGVMTYFPVDAPNIKAKSSAYLGATVQAATYTEFAREEVHRSLTQLYEGIVRQARGSGVHTLSTIQADTKIRPVTLSFARLKQLVEHPTALRVIPHGVDVSAFFPEDTAIAREEFGLPKDAFVVVNVNKNQMRKRLDLCIRAFSEFVREYQAKNALLVIHAGGTVTEGWDLEQLAQYYEVDDQVVLTHRQFGNLSEEQLRHLYNAADVVVNTTGGEGWGLPAFEAAACRRALIVPDWSATGELWAGAALLTEVQDTLHMTGINTAHAVINTAHLVEQLGALYLFPNLKTDVADKCFQRAQKPEYSWDTVAGQFDQVIKVSLGKSSLTKAVTF